MAGRECPICAAVGQGDNDFWVAVSSGEFAEVYLERRSRLPGYCIVVWRHGHIAEPADLNPGQACGYWEEVLAVGRAVRERFDPVKLNYLTLGNTVPHLHTHVVPATGTIRLREGRSPGRRSSHPIPCQKLSCTGRRPACASCSRAEIALRERHAHAVSVASWASKTWSGSMPMDAKFPAISRLTRPCRRLQTRTARSAVAGSMPGTCACAQAESWAASG